MCKLGLFEVGAGHGRRAHLGGTLQSGVNAKWERYVLETVYDPREYAAITHGDRPDFRLAMPRTGVIFGVEVTELFRDTAQARLVKVPGYMQRLWDGAPPIHRDDLTAFDVTTVEVLDEDGNVKYSALPAIIRDVVPRRDHYNALAEVLERKNAAFNGYDQSLAHVNLVVADHFGTNESVERELNSADLFTPRLRAVLADTPYREIFLIAHPGYANSYYIPLRQLELFEMFSLYVSAISELPRLRDSLEETDVAPLFVREMRQRGRDVSLRLESGAYYAGFGAASIALTTGGYSIHDHRDRPFRAESDAMPSPRPDVPPGALADLSAKYAGRLESMGVKCDLSHDSRKPEWENEGAPT